MVKVHHGHQNSVKAIVAPRTWPGVPLVPPPSSPYPTARSPRVHNPRPGFSIAQSSQLLAPFVNHQPQVMSFEMGSGFLDSGFIRRYPGRARTLRRSHLEAQTSHFSSLKPLIFLMSVFCCEKRNGVFIERRRAS